MTQSVPAAKNRAADKSKYKAAFIGSVVDLGVPDDAGNPVTNLAFKAISLPATAETGDANRIAL